MKDSSTSGTLTPPFYGYGAGTTIPLEKASAEQMQTATYAWLCADCVNYRGRLICTFGIFIACEGANMRACYWFKRGVKCPHCGLNADPNPSG